MLEIWWVRTLLLYVICVWPIVGVSFYVRALIKDKQLLQWITGGDRTFGQGVLLGLILLVMLVAAAFAGPLPLLFPEQD